MPATALVKTISLKMALEFAEETESFAKASHQQMSEYIKEAVREKNERQLAERIKYLAVKFSAEAETMDAEFDAASGDGLAQS